jgi:hypothetical protein
LRIWLLVMFIHNYIYLGLYCKWYKLFAGYINLLSYMAVFDPRPYKVVHLISYSSSQTLFSIIALVENSCIMKGWNEGILYFIIWSYTHPSQMCPPIHVFELNWIEMKNLMINEPPTPQMLSSGTLRWTQKQRTALLQILFAYKQFLRRYILGNIYQTWNINLEFIAKREILTNLICLLLW